MSSRMLSMSFLLLLLLRVQMNTCKHFANFKSHKNVQDDNKSRLLIFAYSQNARIIAIHNLIWISNVYYIYVKRNVDGKLHMNESDFVVRKMLPELLDSAGSNQLDIEERRKRNHQKISDKSRLEIFNLFMKSKVHHRGGSSFIFANSVKTLRGLHKTRSHVIFRINEFFTFHNCDCGRWWNI